MKLKNILSVICFLFVATACSMEDGFLDGNTSELVSEAGSAYVSATINLGSIQTKSSNSSAPEEYGADAISSCALFLLDVTGKVAGVHTESYASPGTSKTIKFLTKVNVAAKIVAVVNYNPGNSENILACPDYDALKKYMEHNADYRVKIGEGIIDWTGVAGSTSTTGDLGTVATSITVESRTAIVELVKLSVKSKGAGAHPTVKLTEVSLANLKADGGLYNEGTTIETIPFSFVNNLPADPTYYGDKGYFRKNVYPNTNSGKPITLKLKFTVDGKDSSEFERSYIINRPTEGDFANNSGHLYVEPGYWYQLTATVTVNTDKIDCAIECNVLDWDYKSIEAGDIYPN